MKNGIEKRVLYVEGLFANGSLQCGTGVLLHCQDSEKHPCDIIITCLHVVENEKTKELATKIKVWDISVGYGDNTCRLATINDARLENVGHDVPDLVILQLTEALAYKGITSYGEAEKENEILVYGYPMGKELIQKLNKNRIIPRIRNGKVDLFNDGDGIYTFHGETAPGISGGPLFYNGKLIGIFRGKWTSEGKEYSEGIAIGKYWIEQLCEKAGYTLIIEDTLTYSELYTKNYFAHPYPFFRPFIERKDKRDFLTSKIESTRVIVIHAIPGMGKSALAWKWVNEDLLPKNKFEGVIWWSFNDDVFFENFCQKVFKHISGIKLDNITQIYEYDEQLYEILTLKPFLVVLDGFEKQLNAYYKKGEENASQEYRRCFAPNVGRFIHKICCNPDVKSRFILTSQLVPYELLNERGVLDGCHIYPLEKFTQNEALEFFHVYGVEGNEKDILEICDILGYHPLSLRLILGFISNDPIHPKNISMAERYLSRVWTFSQNAVESTFQTLEKSEKMFLSWCAAFSKTSLILKELSYIYTHIEASNSQKICDDIAKIREIIPTLPEAYKFDSGGKQKTVYSENVSFQKVTKAEEKISWNPVFCTLLISVIERGFLHRDENQFYLHPIIQKYASSKIQDHHFVHIQLANYYIENDLNLQPISLDSLNHLIELYRQIILAEEYDLACDILFSYIVRPLYFDFGAYHVLEKLLNMLPQNVQGHLCDNKRAHLLSLLSRILSKIGKSEDAIIIRKKQIRIRQEQKDIINISAGLGYLSQDYLLLGDIVGAKSCLEESLRILQKIEKDRQTDLMIEEQKALHLTFLSSIFIFIGQDDNFSNCNAKAQSIWKKLDRQIGLYATHTNQILLMLYQNKIKEAVREAEEAVREAEEEKYERGIILAKWLLGSAHRRNGNYASAENCLNDSLNSCRSQNFIEIEPDILIEWAHWKLENKEMEQAYEIGNEALKISENSGYRLKQADIHRFFAEYFYADGRLDSAKEHCKQALLYSFGKGWEDCIENKKWRANWWDCVITYNTQNKPSLLKDILARRCGYKPCMDQALNFWINIHTGKS